MAVVVMSELCSSNAITCIGVFSCKPLEYSFMDDDADADDDPNLDSGT